MSLLKVEKTETPYYKQEGEFVPEYECYLNKPFARGWEVVITHEGRRVCSIQNGNGHCCGSTFLCYFGPTSFVHYFDEVIELLKDQVGKKMFEGDACLKWALQDKVFLYLSDETVFWDSEIRKHPKMSLVYSFNNKATKPYSGSMVHLYVLDLS
jgi:hypothetical protein